MFSYYGSKSKLIKYYPKPKYNLIIEPFAGSAKYALEYPDHRVLLNDSYDVIANIWKYLINATEDQIKSLPNLDRGEDVRKLGIEQVEKDLLGFMVNRGVPYPHNIYTTWAYESNEIEKVKQRIIEYLPRIRHWKIICGDYEDIPNQEATWYIDPPYQNGGERYIHNEIDYKKLADWCKSRKGQVIVCENENANWLPFRPLKKFYGQKKTRIETIWTNEIKGLKYAKLQERIAGA